MKRILAGRFCTLATLVFLLSCASLTAQTPPSITIQPVSQSSAQGGIVTFTVAATGTAPLAYQWRKEGANLSGATASGYTLGSVTTNDAGNYTVRVSNVSGAATSTVAVLTVIVPPSITQQPSSRNTNVGATFTLTVAASGTPPFSYQWRKDGANIPSATLNAYTLANVIAANAGTYTVVVSNYFASVTSAGARC